MKPHPCALSGLAQKVRRLFAPRQVQDPIKKPEAALHTERMLLEPALDELEKRMVKFYGVPSRTRFGKVFDGDLYTGPTCLLTSVNDCKARFLQQKEKGDQNVTSHTALEYSYTPAHDACCGQLTLTVQEDSNLQPDSLHIFLRQTVADKTIIDLLDRHILQLVVQFQKDGTDGASSVAQDTVHECFAVYGIREYLTQGNLMKVPALPF